MPAFVLNTIVGGGFASRLYHEVREKRGLAYGVDTTIVPLQATPRCSSATWRPRTSRSPSRWT